MLRSHQLGGGGDAIYKRWTLFVEKVGSHVILLYWETLLQVILSIYCKIFYQIPLFTILLLFSVFDKAKKPTQSVLLILTLNGLFQKIFRFCTLHWEIPDKTRLRPRFSI